MTKLVSGVVASTAAALLSNKDFGQSKSRAIEDLLRDPTKEEVRCKPSVVLLVHSARVGA
jgi:hypothetical protein